MPVDSTAPRTAYFEKVCLRAPACEKAWIYERVAGWLLQGEQEKVGSLRNIYLRQWIM